MALVIGGPGKKTKPASPAPRKAGTKPATAKKTTTRKPATKTAAAKKTTGAKRTGTRTAAAKTTGRKTTAAKKPATRAKTPANPRGPVGKQLSAADARKAASIKKRHDDITEKKDALVQEIFEFVRDQRADGVSLTAIADGLEMSRQWLYKMGDHQGRGGKVTGTTARKAPAKKTTASKPAAKSTSKATTTRKASTTKKTGTTAKRTTRKPAAKKPTGIKINR